MLGRSPVQFCSRCHWSVHVASANSSSVCSLWDTRAADMQTRFAYFTFLLCWQSPSTETCVQIYILPHNKEWIYISNYAATEWSSESWLRLEPVELDLFTQDDVSDKTCWNLTQCCDKIQWKPVCHERLFCWEIVWLYTLVDANISPERCLIIMYHHFASPTGLILITGTSYSRRIS